MRNLLTTVRPHYVKLGYSIEFHAFSNSDHHPGYTFVSHFLSISQLEPRPV